MSHSPLYLENVGEMVTTLNTLVAEDNNAAVVKKAQRLLDRLDPSKNSDLLVDILIAAAPNTAPVPDRLEAIDDIQVFLQRMGFC